MICSYFLIKSKAARYEPLFPPRKLLLSQFLPFVVLFHSASNADFAFHQTPISIEPQRNNCDPSFFKFTENKAKFLFSEKQNTFLIRIICPLFTFCRRIRGDIKIFQHHMRSVRA